MRRLFTSEDRVLLQYLRDMLQQRGIATLIKNQHLQGAVGELPVNECWPQLWVMQDADYDIARRLMEEAQAAPPPGATRWQCRCGEWLEPQFSICWNCGAART